MTSSTMSPTATTGQMSGDDGGTTMSTAMDKVQETRRTIGSQVSTKITEQADQRSIQAGEQITSMASAIRETSDTLRTKGQTMPANALDTVSEQVENLGSYLTRMDGTQMLHDLDDAARKRPWAVAAAMFGVGIAASRVFGASSRNRYVARGGQVRSTGYRPAQLTAGVGSTQVGSTSAGIPATPGLGTTASAGATPATAGGYRTNGGTGNGGY